MQLLRLVQNAVLVTTASVWTDLKKEFFVKKTPLNRGVFFVFFSDLDRVFIQQSYLTNVAMMNKLPPPPSLR